jgi:hypothetical protein
MNGSFVGVGVVLGGLVLGLVTITSAQGQQRTVGGGVSGRWEGTIIGLLCGAPADYAAPFRMVLVEDSNGNVTGASQIDCPVTSPQVEPATEAVLGRRAGNNIVFGSQLRTNYAGTGADGNQMNGVYRDAVPDQFSGLWSVRRVN